MAITLDSVKNYLRIDSDITCDDGFLGQCITAANAYCINAIDDFEANCSADAKYSGEADMLLYAIISEMYRNRDARNDNRTDYPYYIRSMVTQLQNYAG